MSKKIDLTKSVYELAQENPELVGIMARLGFSEITQKAMLNSVGKLITIPKGAKMKGIPMEDIIRAFEENGFAISGTDAPEKADVPAAPLTPDTPVPILTKAEENQMIDLYLSKTPLADIAAAMRLSENGVKLALKKLGF